MTRFAPFALLLAGAAVAVLVTTPYRSAPFARADGEWVRVPDLDHLTHTSDAWDYLQLGRQLYRGEGFTSLFTYPPFLPESVPGGNTLAASPAGAAPIEAFPLYWRQPGFPLLVAGAFAVVGGPDPDAMLWLQGIAIVLLPLAAYLLARSLVSPGWALGAGWFALLTPLAVSARSPFTATTWTAVLWTLLAAAFLRARSASAWMGTGILLGLAVLFRLETWLLVPGLLTLLWIARGSGRSFATVVVLGTAILVVLPWHLRLALLTGNPFYNASSLVFHATGTFPGWESSRALAARDLSPWTFLRDHAGEVQDKSLKNVLRFGSSLALLPSPFLAPFLWLAFLRPFPSRPARGFLIGGLVGTLVLVLALSPLEYAPRFLAPFVPLMAVGAVMGLAQIPRFRGALVALGTATGLILLAITFAGRDRDGTARWAAEDLNTLCPSTAAEPLRRDAVALADAPTVYAWIWERPAVWTPVPEDLPGVRRILPGTVALFTRAGGHGDGIAADTPLEYARRGGTLSAAAPPLVVSWPQAPIFLRENRR